MKKKPPDFSEPIVVFPLRRPFILNFPSGGFTVEFPAQQERAEYPNVCTNLSGGNFTISFPNNTAVTIPSSDREITLNGEPFRLPSSESNNLVVKFPAGGTISFPNDPGASMDPLPASMDPLPEGFKMAGNGVSIV